MNIHNNPFQANHKFSITDEEDEMEGIELAPSDTS
jgi:hypothetical protein